MRAVRVEVARGQAVETASGVIVLEHETGVTPQELAGFVARRKAKVDDVVLDDRTPFSDKVARAVRQLGRMGVIAHVAQQDSFLKT